MASSNSTRRAPNFLDLIGQRFGRLIVVRLHSTANYVTRWECKCDCGNSVVVRAGNLGNGTTRSCGCLKHIRCSEVNISHGLSYRREYRIWQKMIARCYRPEDDHYAYYGARGITVCDRWRNSVAAFFADMGPRPTPKHSIDRIDNDGNYEPGNCRWADKPTQMRNRRMAVMLTYKGKTQNLSLWAEELGLKYKLLQHRIARGWSAEKTLSTPALTTWSRRVTRKTSS